MHKLIIASILLLSQTALASAVIALPQGELARRVDTIAFGRIIGTRTLVGQGGQVATEADFQIYRALKGAAAGEVIRIQVPGGEAGGFTHDVPGSPKLRAGQMWVGFLTRHSEATRTHTPWGMAYGLLPVRRDLRGTFWVKTDTEGLVFAGPGQQPDDPLLVFDDTKLDEFFARISLHLQPGTVVPPPKWGVSK